MTPILALRVFRKSFPSQLEALKPSCIMNFLSRKYVQNGSLTCFLMRISERVEISRQLLEYLDNGFQNNITGDESWFNFFTISSKNDNKVWLSREENCPQVARTAKNSKKWMFCIFFSVDGIIARIVVEKGQTVTGDYYAKTILPTTFKKFMEISGRSTVRDVM